MSSVNETNNQMTDKTEDCVECVHEAVDKNDEVPICATESISRDTVSDLTDTSPNTGTQTTGENESTKEPPDKRSSDGANCNLSTQNMSVQDDGNADVNTITKDDVDTSQNTKSSSTETESSLQKNTITQEGEETLLDKQSINEEELSIKNDENNRDDEPLNHEIGSISNSQEPKQGEHEEVVEKELQETEIEVPESKNDDQSEPLNESLPTVESNVSSEDPLDVKQNINESISTLDKTLPDGNSLKEPTVPLNETSNSNLVQEEKIKKVGENDKDLETSDDPITEREGSPRNVFDVFPITVAPVTENEGKKNAEAKKDIDSANDMSNPGSGKVNESEEQLTTSQIADGYLPENESVSLSTCTMNCGEDITENISSKDDRQVSDECVQIHDDYSESTLENQQQSNTVQEKDTLQEAEILKKAKQKYQLKELRVALHSGELIKDLSELSQVKGQSEKGSNVKVSKSKTKDEQDTNVTKTNEPVLEPAQKEEKHITITSTVKDTINSPSETVHHYNDSDCAKPLKKRCRRGYDGLQDNSKIEATAETTVSSECAVVQEPSTTVSEDMLDKSVIEPELTSISEQSTEKQNIEAITENKRKTGKLKKGKKRSKSKPVVKETTQVIEQSNVPLIEQSIVPLIEQSNSNVECDTVVDTSSPTESSHKANASKVQLKKYPGRSCKLRNQLPQAIVKPKKLKSPPKIKKTDKSDDSEQKTSAIIPDLKVKKKRKRKVKPWSWGNEKKKYKPKPKILHTPEAGFTSNIQSDSIINHENDGKVQEMKISEEFNGDVSSNNLTSINEDSLTITEEIKICENSKEKEPDAVTEDKTITSENEHFNGLKVSKVSRPKKKGKRGKKSKAKSDTVDCNNHEQSIEQIASEPVASDRGNKTVCEAQEIVLSNNVIETSRNVDSQTVMAENSEIMESEHKVDTSENKDTGIENDKCDDNFENSKQIVPKRKRGRKPGPKKGEGRGKAKKQKLSNASDSVLSASVNEQIIERTDNVEGNPAIENLNQEHEGAPAVMENNEVHVDHYPHVSPDSGIQSLAGSPAGNESPNSVIINVDNTNNPPTDNKQENKNEHDTVEPSTSGIGLEPDCVENSRTEVTKAQNTDDTDNEIVTNEIVSDKCSKDKNTSKDSTDSNVNLNTSDNSKETVSNSPSKKKNRAKFLHLKKASTLLQKGRLPTDEEIEKRLDDKFDYPEKSSEKLPINPPIDVYSQHMNSFQVTHGSYSEMMEKSTETLDRVLNSDLLKTVKDKRKGKKSKHKSKTRKKSASDTSRASLFEQMSNIQSLIESTVHDQPVCVTAVSTSSTVISDFSPIYHSSSDLTPVTLTLSTVAVTDTVSTSMSVTKPISSVLPTNSHTITSSSTISSNVQDSSVIHSVIDNNSEHICDRLSTKEVLTSDDHENEFDSEVPASVTTNIKTLKSHIETKPVKRKRGRPPNKKKGLISMKNKVLNKVIRVNKPSSVKKFKVVKEKRKRGRPKGSKNKKSLEKESLLLENTETAINETDSQQKLTPGKTKAAYSPIKENKEKHSQSSNFETFKDRKAENQESLSFGSHSQGEVHKPPNFINKMAWRESSVLGHDQEEKKKRGPGRPRKKPLVAKTGLSKSQSVKESKPIKSASKDTIYENRIDIDADITDLPEPQLNPMEEESLPSVFKDAEILDESVKQLPKIRKSKLHPMLKKGKRGRKKGFKVKRKSEQSVQSVESVEDCEPEENMADLQPARSVSSHDSDTSGAGSSFCSRSFQVQMWMDMSKIRRKKNKQKLRYFRSKHKNIIDPVFISKVDCLINDFTQVSISPPNETFLKVRPWEVPLPSIFKIVRINIKKKKKDRLFVFEKAKPLKPKNELESGPKDKIKLGRKIGDHIMGLNDITDQHYYLPPKKRHKLFSGLGPNDGADGHMKPEKRKAGRPRKVRHLSTDQGPSFSFGEVHKTKQGLGQDDTEALASFASVAALSSQSPNTSFSPERASSSFTTISPKTGSDNIGESVYKPDSTAHRSASDSAGGSIEVGDIQDRSSNQSCDKCSELQAACLDESYLSAKVNSPKIVTDHLNRKVKRLKRKYRKSKKLTRVKQKSRPVLKTIEREASLDLDSSVRSVCSESEPLPSLYSDKRKLDSDSEPEIVVDKRHKVLKRRTSDASQESDTAAVRKQSGPINTKKKYQKAGLYSDAYKDDEKNETKEAVNTYFTFDLPLHFGQHQLRNMIDDFQLPYDVWWLHFNDMLPKKGDGKQYRRIRNNIYVDARPACRYEAHACSCRKPLNVNEKGCGEDCINRLVYTECSPDLCPCYDQCSNQNIQKHQFAAGLQKFLTKDRGFGVRTTKPIRIGQLVAEYCGEVVSEQEFRRRMTEEYSQDRNHYCLNLDSGTVIDGYRKGNIARFVNHSCQPNCEMQKWNVDGVYHMCLFAMRDIEPSEELVYDYNFQSFNHDAQQLCKCGSKECRGIIGGKKQWFNGQVKTGEKSTGKKSKLLKDKRKSKHKGDKMKDKNKKSMIPGYQQGLPNSGGHPIPPFFTYPIKPLSKKERIFARKHAIFLVRNFDRIRDMKDRLDQETYKGNKEDEDYIKGTHFTKRDVFIAQLTALKTSRSMKTRRLTVAEEDTEVSKMARIAGVCKEIYSAMTAAKDTEGSYLASDLYHLPSKKKHPRYYQVIEEPIDLTMIQKKILSGMYQSVELFEKDVMKLFQNVELYCGKKSEMGDKIKGLRAVLTNAKRESLSQIQELLGSDSQSSDSQAGTLSDVDIQVATPTTSVSSESDISEISDNKALSIRDTKIKRESLSQIQELLGSDSQSTDSQAGTLSDVDIQVATPTTSVSLESDISEISDNKGEWLQGEDDEEEIIRCICGIFKDEGLMIQCDKCYIWQHTDCMRVKGDIGHYLCELCDPRPVNRLFKRVKNQEADTTDGGNKTTNLMSSNYSRNQRPSIQENFKPIPQAFILSAEVLNMMEVELVPGTDISHELSEDGNRYFMTLMRDDMQIRLGACVYVMKENQSRRYSYKKSGGLDKDRMDIFRIERLWKNKKGEKFAFGHMYVRPHETFHEPNRKFFPNEVFRTPLYEMFELESITGYCCVLDLLTYCKGKPKGYREEDLYICEHRMDKTLHLFYKISAKQRCTVNTKSYCFDMYEKRLNPKRTYSPHEVPESYKRNWREKSSSSEDTNQEKKPRVVDEEEDIPLVKVKIERRKEKRERVNKIVDSLSRGILSPSKKRSDLTYLLIDRVVTNTSTVS